MYESYGGALKTGAILSYAALKQSLDDPRSKILLKSILVWGEHCTECAMPSCYTNCQFYTPRQDLHCRRFRSDTALSKSADRGSDWMTVHFGKWASLQSSGPIPMFTPKTIKYLELIDNLISAIIWRAPIYHGIKTRLTSWWTGNKAKVYGKLTKYCISQATHLSLEAYNHAPEQLRATLTIVRQNKPEDFIQNRLYFPQGYSKHDIPLGDRFKGVEPGSKFWVSLIMDADIDNALISFREFYMVSRNAESGTEESAAPSAEKMIKCVVWDLDNTIWDGTLLESGLQGIKLRPWARKVIEELDTRGILQSIASKNNHDDAIAALKRFNLERFFLYPQISWTPKSVSVQKIRERLNIGLDTFCFIDDEPFERAEVASALPEVAVVPDSAAMSLILHPRFQHPITEESRQRRKYYLENIYREETKKCFRGDYESFLKSCHLRLSITPLADAQLERVHELTQRTNQMNFSGTRYSKDLLKKTAADPDKSTFVMSCSDIFGNYGVIGFAVLDKPGVCIEGMAFSCRIQSKRIEHSFLIYMASELRAQGHEKLSVIYRKTGQNSQVGRVFEDLHFLEEPLDNNSTVRTLKLDHEFGQNLVQVRTGNNA